MGLVKNKKFSSKELGIDSAKKMVFPDKTIAIIGLGYVGLTLALVIMAKAYFHEK